MSGSSSSSSGSGNSTVQSVEITAGRPTPMQRLRSCCTGARKGVGFGTALWGVLKWSVLSVAWGLLVLAVAMWLARNILAGVVDPTWVRRTVLALALGPPLFYVVDWVIEKLQHVNGPLGLFRRLLGFIDKAAFGACFFGWVVCLLFSFAPSLPSQARPAAEKVLSAVKAAPGFFKENFSGEEGFLKKAATFFQETKAVFDGAFEPPQKTEEAEAKAEEKKEESKEAKAASSSTSSSETKPKLDLSEVHKRMLDNQK